ncbi:MULTISPECIES: hypothetical protein [Achromobacter]|uniref:hypothetical protein n=1 Tax=Achromobacter TaxID=222 RepID=UPI0023F61C76|nr:hypothetical protein [Achromobacter anxifer]MDF8363269.1 hypothetical protein [Achromobacter anxifer]
MPSDPQPPVETKAAHVDDPDLVGIHDPNLFEIPEGEDPELMLGLPGERRDSASGFSFARGDANGGGRSSSVDYGAPHEDYSSFDAAELSRGDNSSLDGEPVDQGKFAQLGVGEGRPMDVVAGIPQHVFSQFDPSVPPGSHYEPWVWNIMDKPGHVTLEIYVDAAARGQDEEHERQYRPAQRKASSGVVRQNPTCDLAKHCLISVPVQAGAPWGMARRVLLVPHTFRKLPDFHQRQSRSPLQRPAAPQPPQYEGDPSGAGRWLYGAPHHHVLFGRCAVQTTADDVPAEYWMVLSLQDAKQVHADIYGGPAGKGADPRHVFGREGVVESVSHYDEFAGRRVSEVEPLDKRRPVPAARRFLGMWTGDAATDAIRSAAAGAGPMLPRDWPESDIEEVRRTHGGLYRAAREEAVGSAPTIVPQVSDTSGVPMDSEMREIDSHRQQSIPSQVWAGFARPRG